MRFSLLPWRTGQSLAQLQQITDVFTSLSYHNQSFFPLSGHCSPQHCQCRYSNGVFHCYPINLLQRMLSEFTFCRILIYLKLWKNICDNRSDQISGNSRFKWLQLRLGLLSSPNIPPSRNALRMAAGYVYLLYLIET